jgi:hypothetical protein
VLIPPQVRRWRLPPVLRLCGDSVSISSCDHLRKTTNSLWERSLNTLLELLHTFWATPSRDHSGYGALILIEHKILRYLKFILITTNHCRVVRVVIREKGLRDRHVAQSINFVHSDGHFLSLLSDSLISSGREWLLTLAHIRLAVLLDAEEEWNALDISSKFTAEFSCDSRQSLC